MIGAAYVSWDFIASTIEARGLDRCVIYGGGRGARILDAEGTEQVLQAVAYARQNVTGGVRVVAWVAADGRKEAFDWSAGAAPGAVAGVAADGVPVSPILERLYDARLELERERMANEYGDGGPWERIAGVLEQLAPAILARVFPLPAAAAAAVDAGAVAGPAPDEMRELLADVAAYARANPAQARVLHEQLKRMKDANDTNAG